MSEKNNFSANNDNDTRKNNKKNFFCQVLCIKDDKLLQVNTLLNI